jgi:hypothetical protein
MFILTHPVNFPCGRKPERPEKTHDFRKSVDWLFSHESTHESIARLEPRISEVKGACSDDCATEYHGLGIWWGYTIAHNMQVSAHTFPQFTKFFIAVAVLNGYLAWAPCHSQISLSLVTFAINQCQAKLPCPKPTVGGVAPEAGGCRSLVTSPKNIKASVRNQLDDKRLHRYTALSNRYTVTWHA